jgi:hypothetical protein
VTSASKFQNVFKIIIRFCNAGKLPPSRSGRMYRITVTFLKFKSFINAKVQKIKYYETQELKNPMIFHFSSILER